MKDPAAGTGSGLDDVYQAVILDHSRSPRNRGTIAGATHNARGDNPFCGDRFQVSLSLAGERIGAIGVEGAGCAISTASASLMSEHARGRTVPEIEELARGFERLVGGAASDADKAALGDLTAFAGVTKFPVRVKCARLPWKTLLAALAGASDPVSTETP